MDNIFSYIHQVWSFPKKLEIEMPYDLASPLMGIFSKHVSRDEWIRCGTRGYSAINKNEILSFVTTWMDLEGIMLSKMSQIEKDKHSVILFTYRIF